MIWWAWAGLGFAAVTGYGVYVLAVAGQLRALEPMGPRQCERIEGIVGGEDFALLPDGHTVLVSADDRRAVLKGEARPGALYALDLSQEKVTPVLLTPDAPATFHPHGISYVADGEGTGTVFVVNHPGASLFGKTDPVPGPRHTIEIYRWQGGALTHVSTAPDDPLLISPNDVAGVDAGRFYFSNDHGTSERRKQVFEDYTRRAWGDVVYFDGERYRQVADGFRYTNGVSLTPSGDRLLVAATTQRTVSTFRRDPTTGDLTLEDTLDLRTGVDNIVFGAGGQYWIAGHPRMLDFVKNIKDPSKLAPSQVWEVTPQAEGWSPRRIYEEEGSLIGSSSVALVAAGRLLIGTVMDPHLLVCRMGEGT